MDPTYVQEKQGEFMKCDWKEFYGDTKEAIPLMHPRHLEKK